MDSAAQWQQARIAEFRAAHPEVTICCVEGTWRATVHLDRGYGEMHAADEAALISKLMAALGG